MSVVDLIDMGTSSYWVIAKLRESLSVRAILGTAILFLNPPSKIQESALFRIFEESAIVLSLSKSLVQADDAAQSLWF
jgi:hypothetical protein